MIQYLKQIWERIRRNWHFVAILLMIFLLIAAYLYDRIVITVKPGEGGVLYKRFGGGTVIDKVYAEGIHFILPWDYMFIYNVRVQETSRDFDVLTKNGLKVHLYISIRFAPEYHLLGVLHQRVGPNYVNIVVVPEIEAVLRVIIGRMEAEEVYTTERAIIEKSLNEAVEQVAQRFVIVDDVIIKKIHLPSSVEKAIQNKIEQKHIAEAYIFRLQREKREAERKRIEAQGIHDYNRTVAQSLTPEVLRWKGIQATLELSRSSNAKVVVVGSGGTGGLPLIGSIPMDVRLKEGTEPLAQPDFSKPSPTPVPSPETPPPPPLVEGETEEKTETTSAPTIQGGL